MGAELVIVAMYGKVCTFRAEEEAANVFSVTVLQGCGRAPEQHTVLNSVTECFRGVDCATGRHKPVPR